MKKLFALGFVALLAAAFAASAGAGRQQVIANPATSCKALVALPGTGYTDFGSCVSTIEADVAAYRFPSDEDPNVLLSLDQRCTQFENAFFTYPGFYLDEGPEWPFVTFTINNHAQCELAIYTYHALASAGFGA